MNVMMKCGHAANAQYTDTDGNKKPCCAICAGINSRAYEIADDVPDLSGRKARCSYCGKTTESNFNLAFFEYRPDRETDSFYDGCMGWD